MDFSLRPQSSVTDANFIAGAVIANQPIDGAALIYNAAGNSLTFAPVVTPAANATFTGDIVLDGTTRFDANGTPINGLEFGTVILPAAPIPPDGNVNQSITFDAFATVPTVNATVSSTDPADVGLVVMVTNKLTTGATFNVHNSSIPVPTVGTLSVDWIAIG